VPIYETDAEGCIVLPVYVQPGAHGTGLAGRHGDMVKVRVAAPAERNRANVAVCHMIADELGVRRGDVEVVAGRTSRRKRVRVHGVDAGAVDVWLARHDLA